MEPYNFPKSSRGLEYLLDGPPAGTVSTPVHVVMTGGLSAKLEGLPTFASTFARDICKFKAKTGETCLVPSPEGSVSMVLLGGGDSFDMWAYSALARLPQGTYSTFGEEECLGAGGDTSGLSRADSAALGFVLGHYSFDRYKKQPAAADAAGQPDEGGKACLVLPRAASRSRVEALSRAYYWARDLITTPAEHMGPQHLVAEAWALAAHHAPAAKATTISGDDLLAHNYPAIHTVGRASSRPPCLVDITWAPPGVADPSQLPLLALVGKGVCFDSGGLDIKTAAGMKLMKKDMGGAALVLALAHVVMSAQLPVRLRVLVPAVENSISGNAYRPLDVLDTRAGISVENGNTDAEGRLILCDCLAEASSASPDLLMDVATLTGAARVALGPDVPAVFCSDHGVWEQLAAAAEAMDDPLWRLPFHKPYRKMLDSKVADIHSTGSMEGQAGAILAALFLQEFAKVPRYLHMDTGAYVSGGSVGPGRPEGGEAVGLRALWAMLHSRYAAGAGSTASTQA